MEFDDSAELTHQANVDFYRCREQNGPAKPGCIIGVQHALVDVDGSTGARDIDENAQPEDGNDGNSLPGRQLQAPNQRHWEDRYKEVG